MSRPTTSDGSETGRSQAPIAWIGLGGNRSATIRQMQRALTRLALHPGIRLLAISPLYRTEPVGPIRHQPWFFNAVAILDYRHGPCSLLRLLQRIEADSGRDRQREIRWGPRPLDLDLLFFGSRRIRSKRLNLPHPRLHLRRFVLQPCADLAPGWIHPVCGKTIDRLLDEVDDTARIIRLGRMGVDSLVISRSRDPSYNRVDACATGWG
ncbi:MAG: 2-amino-4-hydroxy-6-hydroxymethyldihydropteridine diphosphokinase [Magnetococcus sp. YQC-9]